MYATEETQPGWAAGRTGRRVVAAAAGLSLALVAAALFVWHLAAAAPDRAAVAPIPISQALDPPQPAQALVFVSGAVATPGLYVLPATARVSDAIAAAGGLTPAADLGHLPDLAERVRDGRQVNVPFLRSTSSGGTSATRFANRLDVNTATLEELDAVPGMPLGLPEAILDARNLFGPFQSLSQLKTILGLDGPTFTAVRPYLRAGQSVR